MRSDLSSGKVLEFAESKGIIEKVMDGTSISLIAHAGRPHLPGRGTYITSDNNTIYRMSVGDKSAFVADAGYSYSIVTEPTNGNEKPVELGIVSVEDPHVMLTGVRYYKSGKEFMETMNFLNGCAQKIEEITNMYLKEVPIEKRMEGFEKKFSII